MSRLRSIILAVFSGLLLILIFPNYLHLPAGMLAWVALIPLLAAVEDASPKKAFWLGSLAGMVAFLGTIPWIVYCLTVYGHMSYPLSITLFLLLCIVLAAYVGATMAVVRYIMAHFNFPLLLILPAAWVSVELIRTYFPFGGFPWALLGYSQHAYLPVIQIAEITGVYGVSALILLVNAALYLAGRSWIIDKTLAWRELAAGLATLAIVLIFGFIRIGQVDKAFKNRPEIKVALVQGNIDQDLKWSRELFWKELHTHLDITDRLLPQKPDLVIWPEAAITTNFYYQWQRRSQVVQALEKIDTNFLVGGLTIENEDNENSPLYNSAFLLSPHAQSLIERYDKMHLVPFSEYVPMKKLFFFVKALAGGYAGASTPGTRIVVFKVPGFSLGCVICYEVIFGNLVRKFKKAGAGFMTTITNDAWFGRGSAPYQHHSMIQFRCVENRVYFARAANTGISSFIDPVGRVLKQSDIYVEAGMIGAVKQSPLKTIYTAVGDVFAYLCLAFCAALLLRAIAASRFSFMKKTAKNSD